MSELYKEHLRKVLGKQKNHRLHQALNVVPFSQRTGKMVRLNFNNVMGEYVRRICDLELNFSNLENPEYILFPNQDSGITDNIKFIWHLMKQVKVNDEDDQRNFSRFLNEYLLKENALKVIHPFMFNYIRVDKASKSDLDELAGYGRFLNDVFVRDKNKFEAFFNSDETENILIELVIKQEDILQPSSKREDQEYRSLLEPISKLYEEDLLYLKGYKDYFIDAFPLLTHFYVFTYVCQLVIKFERFSKADYTSLVPLDFTLEEERLSSRRRAASDISDVNLKYILSKVDNLFAHVQTLSQISHNKVNISSADLILGKKINVLTYTRIKELIEEGSLDEGRFLADLQDWMKGYTEIFNKRFEGEYTPRFNDIDEGLREMFDLVKTGTNYEVRRKFGKNLEDLGAGQFIKSRGSIGRVLNISNEFLLLLTAVSVKDTRIPLWELFDEYEKRGVYLDRYSKGEAVYILDKLNLIDKKSDSGDAQYVKPIL